MHLTHIGPAQTMKKRFLFDSQRRFRVLSERGEPARKPARPTTVAEGQNNHEIGRTSRLSDNLRRLLRELQLPALLGVLGGSVLALGVRAPLIHIPIAGSISYLRHPKYFSHYDFGGLIILVAGGLSIASALLKRYKALWVTGSVALIQLIATIAAFQQSAAAVAAKADQPDLVDPMLMWAGAALKNAHFEWGLMVIGAGALMVLAAAICEAASGRRI
jgi:hypothetical protein